MSSKLKQSTGTVPKTNKVEKKVEKCQERRTSLEHHHNENGFAVGECTTIIDRDRDHPPKLENTENQNTGNNKCCMGTNETLDEHMKLERKLFDLYAKKEQMASLVDELQTMNEVAHRSLNWSPTPARNVPIEYERIVPIELIPSSKTSSPSISNFRMSPVIPKPVAEIHECESRDDDESTIGGNDDSLSEKIAEINTMKNQLQRLKNLMNTVKIIEIKNGDCEENDNVSVESSPSHANYNESHYENVLSSKRDSGPSEQLEHEDEPDMDERVRLLQSMTQDLKLQAISIAEERDRLRDIKNEMGRRRENEGLKKITNLNQTRSEDKSHDQCLGSDAIDKSAEQSANHKDNSCNLTSQYGSTRSNFDRQSEQFSKSTQLPPVIPGKISSITGINGSTDVRSLNSNSSRGISLPPPMRNFGPEERRTNDTLRLSSMNQQNLENTQDWQHLNSYCNFGPQSPQFHCHHSVNSDQNYNCRPIYYPSISSNQSGIAGNDHALLQQFIQTQQMLINSVCQFNQLLWDQQREINNLNTAVLLIQERMFNSTRNGFNESLNSTRAETVPPNVTYNNSYPCHGRAQSEQPSANQNGCISNCQSHSPYAQYPFAPYQSPPVQLDVQQNNIRSRRFNNIIHHNQIDSSACCYPTHLLNNDLHTSISNSSNYQTNSSQSYMQQQNNNNTANNIANANNQLRQQNIAAAVAATTASPALNNQVPPGNRANNYWDNFRSYSRQNLLSSNSCKSNEEASSINNLPQNRERDQSHQNQSSRLSTHMTHNNLPLVANKYSIHFQNQSNQQQNAPYVAQHGQGTTFRNPEDLNINQSMNQQLLQHSNDALGNDQISSINNLNMNFGPFHQPNDVASNFMNSINLELNELKPNTSKMIPKRSTGGHKRKPQLTQPFEQNNLYSIQQGVNGIDSNLSKTVMTNDSKSSEKSFEALKENVYQEVSALIVANESRPNFLINLFRELQLISTSDPLRSRLMQTFHDLYNRYESHPLSADNSAISNQPQNTCEYTPKSNDNMAVFDFNRKRKNNLSSADGCGNGENSCDGDEDLAEADQNCNADVIYSEDYDADGATGFDNSTSEMVILPLSPTSNSDGSPPAVADELN